jgi:hypothetical protein
MRGINACRSHPASAHVFACVGNEHLDQKSGTHLAAAQYHAWGVMARHLMHRPGSRGSVPCHRNHSLDSPPAGSQCCNPGPAVPSMMCCGSTISWQVQRKVEPWEGLKHARCQQTHYLALFQPRTRL